MSVSDPIADMLTRIRNAISVRHDSVQIPASNVKTEIARILKSEGFIENFNIITSKSPQPDDQGMAGLLSARLRNSRTKKSKQAWA